LAAATVALAQRRLRRNCRGFLLPGACLDAGARNPGRGRRARRPRSWPLRLHRAVRAALRV